jgi:hypothetical protein
VTARAASRAWSGALLAIVACVHPAVDAPAVIIAPTAASHAALAHAVSAALGQRPAAIAADALTVDSVLWIDRAVRRDLGGVLDGRAQGSPERFRLITHDGHCILIHDRTGRRFRLAAATCAAR